MVVSQMAGPTGFEPAISSVTGRRDRPASLRAPSWRRLRLSYISNFSSVAQWCKRFRIGVTSAKLGSVQFYKPRRRRVYKIEKRHRA